MQKFKSFFLISLFFVCLFLVSGCTTTQTLLILNWGEYINDDVVRRFEDYEKSLGRNVIVNVGIADSNELFYSKVKSGTTAYDIVVPSDYTVEKMEENNLLEKLDFSKIPNYNKGNFMAGVNAIIEDMNKTKEGIDYADYCIPYFWGTWGLMYNKECVGLEEAITKNGWDAYFNMDLLPSGCRVGMYSVSRYAYAAAMFYNHMSPNEIGSDYLTIAKNALKQHSFTEWGTDTLKKGIEANNLDLAFVWTGDCLDMSYAKLDEGVAWEDLTFDIYIPEETIAFMDTLVMPKNARHKDLAYDFINFMLDTENAYENASVVGYCTPLQSSYDKIVNYVSDPTNEDDTWLTNWGRAVKTYYPTHYADGSTYRGTPLSNFDKNYLTEITNMVNNVKTGK
jgi:spermidine/putrescine-binding protein